MEETLESQAEYPQEVVEEVEEEEEEAEEEVSLWRYLHNKHLPMGEINSLATRPLYLQEIAPNPKNL